MKIGTKSVLFGGHCFFIHPFFVALAWTKLYGFPTDIRLWVSFFVHDLGYWGKPNMDGAEGETHVLLGANIMHWLFDRPSPKARRLGYSWLRGTTWRDFCLCHSRFYAKQLGLMYSKLCVADKLAVCLEPWWLYLFRVTLSGEVHEYMALAGGKKGSKYAGEPNSKYVSMKLNTGTKRDWFVGMTMYLREWVEEHKDMKEDTWTPSKKQSEV